MKNCKACDKLFEGKKKESICSDECRKNQRCKVVQNYFEEKIKKKFNLSSINKIDENEIFKPIIGYENYHITNYGRVYSVKKQDFMKQNINNKGYKYISVCNKKHKTFTIHRLLGIHFIINDKPNEYNVIDHIDRNRLNNNLSNLRWCNQKINANNSIKVLNRKGSIYKTNDYINGKIYEGWRVNYYDSDNKRKSKRFKDENEAIAFYENKN